jgi:hypothetical protein
MARAIAAVQVQVIGREKWIAKMESAADSAAGAGRSLATTSTAEPWVTRSHILLQRRAYADRGLYCGGMNLGSPNVELEVGEP